MKRKKQKTTTLNNLAQTIERGFAAVSEDIAAVRRDMATKDDIKNVATKDDIKNMATKHDIAGIMTELSDIKRRLKELEISVADHASHTKEIDHALERIAAIEKHLGIKHSTSRQ